MMSNKNILVILIFVVFFSNATLADTFNCTLQSDNVTSICNYPFMNATQMNNFFNQSLNTSLNVTQINAFFSTNCTAITADLQNDLTSCKGNTTALQARIDAMNNIMNFTSNLVTCQIQQANCNQSLSECLSTANNASNAYAAAQAQITAANNQCGIDKQNLQNDFNSTLTNYYIYIGIAFVAGYFVITEIRKRGTTTKSVDERTKEDPSKRFQV